MSRADALELVDELRAAGRITTVEAGALRQGMTPQGRLPPQLYFVPHEQDQPGALRTIADLFDRFHGAKAVAEIVGFGEITALRMKNEANIPAWCWPELIEAASKIGFHLDAATLLHLHLADSPAAPGPEADA